MKSILTSALIIASAALFITGCTDMKTPAAANIAVSKNAIDNAAGADAAQLAPSEIQSAREKLGKANAAMANGDYKLANDLALQAQADAKVAQSKSTSAKTQAAADALNADLRVLQDELNRKNNQ